jgi:hypothetical protein
MQNLRHTLTSLHLPICVRALDRVSVILAAARDGDCPAELSAKLGETASHESAIERGLKSRIDLFFAALSSHQQGLHRLRSAEPMNLLGYAVAYFWEEQDCFFDSCPDGLVDDIRVADHTYRHLHTELDEFRLWTRRSIITGKWARSAATDDSPTNSTLRRALTLSIPSFRG